MARHREPRFQALRAGKSTIRSGFGAPAACVLPEPDVVVDAIGRLVASNDIEQRLAGTLPVERRTGGPQLAQQRTKRLEGQVLLVGPHDARMMRAGYVRADEEFLVELLGRSQPGELDFDVAVRIVVVAHA